MKGLKEKSSLITILKNTHHQKIFYKTNKNVLLYWMEDFKTLYVQLFHLGCYYVGTWRMFQEFSTKFSSMNSVVNLMEPGSYLC